MRCTVMSNAGEECRRGMLWHPNERYSPPYQGAEYRSLGHRYRPISSPNSLQTAPPAVTYSGHDPQEFLHAKSNHEFGCHIEPATVFLLCCVRSKRATIGSNC